MNMNNIEQEKIFAEEQAHLQDTFDRLKKMEKDLEEKILSISQKAAAEKLDIRENLALNFDGDSDSMETYIEFEVMNHAIDQYNIDRDTSEEKLGRVKRLLKAPYFAKVQLQYDPAEEPEEFYIGSTGISEDALEPLVVDWRSPVAETYYNQDNGKTFYTVEGRRIDVDLLLRRQYELSGNHLQAFFDTQIAIEDPLLIHSLTRRRSDKMQAITATIQKEQNKVVRHENVPVLLVNGIAGSGKTSVLLQRIAWLFYRQRDTLRPDEVVLMTLNPIFRRYIDQVLPDMGEMNPVSVTWSEFMDLAKVSRRRGRSSGGADFRTLPETLLKMEEKLPSMKLEADDLRAIHQKSIRVLSKEKIAEVLAMHPGIQTGERLVQIAVDELKELAKREIRRKERDEDEMRESADRSFSGDEEDDSYGQSPARPREREGSRAEENRIQSQYGGAFQAISTCQWLDIDRIGCRLLGTEKLSDLEWLYLKMLLTGQKDLRTKYVMVDEVQDYTPAQLMVLKKYYPRARFMLLGDEFQAIREGSSSFAQIHKVFERESTSSGRTGRTVFPLNGGRFKAGRSSSATAGTDNRNTDDKNAVTAGTNQSVLTAQTTAGTNQTARIAQAATGTYQSARTAQTAAGTYQSARVAQTAAERPSGVTELSLTTSYRSSPEITALFAGLLPPEKQILVSSVQPPGSAPVFHTCETKEDYAQKLVRSVGEAEKMEGLTAIICAGSRSLEKTAGVLSENGVDIPKILSGGRIPDSGVFLITLAHAKGLEFDGVILPDGSDGTYPDTVLSRHRLYTAMSRATRRLTVLAKGSLTPLLKTQ